MPSSLLACFLTHELEKMSTLRVAWVQGKRTCRYRYIHLATMTCETLQLNKKSRKIARPAGAVESLTARERCTMVSDSL